MSTFTGKLSKFDNVIELGNGVLLKKEIIRNEIDFIVRAICQVKDISSSSDKQKNIINGLLAGLKSGGTELISDLISRSIKNVPPKKVEQKTNDLILDISIKDFFGKDEMSDFAINLDKENYKEVSNLANECSMLPSEDCHIDGKRLKEDIEKGSITNYTRKLKSQGKSEKEILKDVKNNKHISNEIVFVDNSIPSSVTGIGLDIDVPEDKKNIKSKKNNKNKKRSK